MSRLFFKVFTGSETNSESEKTRTKSQMGQNDELKGGSEIRRRKQVGQQSLSPNDEPPRFRYVTASRPSPAVRFRFRNLDIASFWQC